MGLSAAGTADPAALPAGRGGATAEGRARPCSCEAGPVPGRGPAGAAVLSRGWEAAGLAVGPGGAAPALPPRTVRVPPGAAGRAAAHSEGCPAPAAAALPGTLWHCRPSGAVASSRASAPEAVQKTSVTFLTHTDSIFLPGIFVSGLCQIFWCSPDSEYYK